MEYDEADFQHDEDNDGYADEYPEVIDITTSQTTCQGAACLEMACLGVACLGVACLGVAYLGVACLGMACLRMACLGMAYRGCLIGGGRQCWCGDHWRTRHF